jgi:hypothetical protein
MILRMRQRVTGWSAPVALPARLEDLHGPTTGVVRLPLSIHSSGAGPDTPFDLDNPAARARMYAIVMENAPTAADVAAWLDAILLQQMWPTLWLSPHVRRAWAPLLETRSTPATVD